MTTLIPNYEILELLDESPQATIYKAYHKKNPSHLLVLKVLNPALLSDEKKSQFRQKIEQLRILKDPIVITPDTFETKGDTCFITQSWFEGITLDKFIKLQPVSMKDFFTIACGLSRALDIVHEAGIIHGGIKPHNILINPQSLDIRLIDFISPLDIRDVSHFIYDTTYIRETLSYTSPEQTGRINHRIEFSSDMYSLGIVFYELLTRHLPFSSADPLEIIHSHLAAEAPMVHTLNTKVPIIVSRIIARLMIKEPEKRYQSSNGLLSDLVRCRDEYSATGSINEFPLEIFVYTHRVTFISKMVGRDSETKIILEEYEKAAHGQFCPMFISGLSGIGKTRLIQELQKPIVKHHGYFTSGKFDVYQKNIPYSSLINALRNLIRTFLTESDDRVESRKRKILETARQNGKVLTDVIPELEIITGPQPDVQILPPVESLNRFHDVFGSFLACLATMENPLVLFIDDLQWCDTASFDFFTNIFLNYKDYPYLFFIGAYRNNEVDASHPLTKLIRSAKENRLPLKEICLRPLNTEHCFEMVSYILNYPSEQVRSLASFISNLSEGNPLFVSESLSFLHNEDLLFTDDSKQWHWNMDKIRQSQMPTSVVALFSSKIQKMSRPTINLLEYCACMGNAFSPQVLSSIRDVPLLKVFEILKPALGLGLLMENKNQLQFIHDKVQEAALSAIPEGKRRQIHREIGTHLYASVPADSNLEKVENLFAVAAHLNLGRDADPDPETARLLSDINYHAGKKALDSLATMAANEYFRLSRELLPADCWTEANYERTFRIFQNEAKTELMCGNFENSEKLLYQLLEHARTDLDKAECLTEQTTSLSSIGNFIKAIETANKGLTYFDKAIPENDDEADIKRKKLMSGISAMKTSVWETILNMPFTTDRKSKIELKFYSELIPDLYMSGLVPQLYLSAAQSTQHCLAGGMDESVIYSFSIMGLQLGEEEDFDQAFRYEDLARELSARYPDTFGATRGMNGIVWCNAHSRSHPASIADYSLKSIQCGKNCGDLYNAGLSYGPLMWNLQVQGADFSKLEDYIKECLQFSNRYNLSFSAGLAEAMQAGWITYMKKDCPPVPMEEKLKQWKADNHVASAGSYYVHMALAHYYSGDYAGAQKYLEEVRSYLTGLTDNVLKRQWYVFLVLNALKLFERGIRFTTKEELFAEILPLIKKVETWAQWGPLLRPYLALIYAELERVTGSFKESRSLYLDAINSAHEQRYIFLEGYLNECLAEFMNSKGLCSYSVYLNEALRLYRKCHAERKEINLIEKYSDFFEETTGTSTQAAGTAEIPALDIAYLMKSSLAISAEIEQDNLLKKIMNVVIESSGAQHGYLLIEDDGNLFIRSESHIAGLQTTNTLNQKLEDAEGLGKAIIRYVQRTGEKVILNDACREGMFRDNTEIQELNLKSVLCLPIMKESALIGEIYLENRLIESVFTGERIQMTELLASQAAISLKNAWLVENMKMTEKELQKLNLDLQRKMNEFNILFESLHQPVIVFDIEGKVVLLNPAALKVFGHSAGIKPTALPVNDLYRKFRMQHIDGTPVRETELPSNQALAGKNIRNQLFKVTNLNEEEIIFDISASPLVLEGRIIGAVSLWYESQEALRKTAEELRQSNYELEQFAYISSHDLQEPLRQVLSFTSLLARSLPEKLDSKQSKYIHFINEATLQMSNVIHDLLTFSRVGRGEKQLESTSLNELLASTLSVLDTTIKSSNARITYDELPSLMVVPTQIIQLFQNLLTNAIKFRKKGVRPKIHIGVSEDEKNWIFRVEDNGIGIDGQYFEKIFGVFQRLHERGEYEGTGIGLSICKKIVEQYKGNIWLESELNKRTTFYFTLPKEFVS